MQLTASTRSVKSTEAQKEGARWLIVDAEGNPVEGANIEAMPDREYLRQSYAFPGVARTAKTDADGAFRLEGLSGPTVALYLNGPGKGWNPTYADDVAVDEKVPGVGSRQQRTRSSFESR